MEKSYHKLKVFQKAKLLVLLIYELTKKFPKEELFVLVPQIRRSAISVVANIVEGYSKSSTAEFIRFLDISIGSLVELEVYIDLSFELKFIDENDYQKAGSLVYEVKNLLYSFQYSLKRRRREILESK